MSGLATKPHLHYEYQVRGVHKNPQTVPLPDAQPIPPTDRDRFLSSTAELMKGFYRHLKAGKTKDEALRLAQVELIHSADFAQPRFWAAFQINGDWR